jgi:hypothetical protein
MEAPPGFRCSSRDAISALDDPLQALVESLAIR